MNWDAIGAIAEIIGAIAVVLSLVYVAVQIRSGTTALRTTLRDSAFNYMNEWNYALNSDPELPWIFKRGLRDPSDLNEKEATQFHHMLYSFLKVFENVYLHYLDGTIAREAWDNNKEILLLYCTQNGARQYWEERRRIFDPRFRALLESAEVSSLVPSDRLFKSAK